MKTVDVSKASYDDLYRHYVKYKVSGVKAKLSEHKIENIALLDETYLNILKFNMNEYKNTLGVLDFDVIITSETVDELLLNLIVSNKGIIYYIDEYVGPSWYTLIQVGFSTLGVSSVGKVKLYNIIQRGGGFINKSLCEIISHTFPEFGY